MHQEIVGYLCVCVCVCVFDRVVCGCVVDNVIVVVWLWTAQACTPADDLQTASVQAVPLDSSSGVPLVVVVVVVGSGNVVVAANNCKG